MPQPASAALSGTRDVMAPLVSTPALDPHLPFVSKATRACQRGPVKLESLDRTGGTTINLSCVWPPGSRRSMTMTTLATNQTYRAVSSSIVLCLLCATFLWRLGATQVPVHCPALWWVLPTDMGRPALCFCRCGTVSTLAACFSRRAPRWEGHLPSHLLGSRWIARHGWRAVNSVRILSRARVAAWPPSKHLESGAAAVAALPIYR
jgi:hypothetical protein